MPIYKVKAPNGKIISVNAPEGASQEDVFDFAYENYQTDNLDKETVSDKIPVPETPNNDDDDGYLESALKGAGNFVVGLNKGKNKPFEYAAEKLSTGINYGLDAITGGDFVKRGQAFDKKRRDNYQKNYGDSTAAYVGEMVGEAGVLAAPTNMMTGGLVKAGAKILPYVAKTGQTVAKIPYAGKLASKLGQIALSPAKNRTVQYMGNMALDGAVENTLSGVINNSTDLTNDAVVGGLIGGGVGLGGKAIEATYKGFVSPTVKSIVKKADNITPDMKRRILKNSVLSNKLSEIYHKNYDIDAMQGKLKQARDIGLNPELNDISDNLFVNEAVGVRSKNEINDIVNPYDTARDKNIDDVLKKIIPENISAESVGGNIRAVAKDIVDKKNQKNYASIQDKLNQIVPQNADIAVVGNQLKTEIDDFVTNTDNQIIKNAKPLYDKAKRTDAFYAKDNSMPAYDNPDIKDLSVNLGMDNYTVDDAINILRGNQDIASKRPITQFIIDNGGIKPGSDAAMKLYDIGIKPGENAPVGLFNQNGISNLDSFPDVDKGFSGRYNLKNTDEFGRIDYYEILDRMADEANGLGQFSIKDTPKRRDLSLTMQSMGLNPDEITKDDLVKALIERKKQNFDPREPERLALLDQADNAKTANDLTKNTYDKYDLYKKYGLPKQLNQAQPDTGRFENIYDDSVKFRRISTDDYEKPFHELPIDEFTQDFNNYIKPESVSLKDDKVIQDLIADVRRNAQDFVAKNAPDDSIEMLLEVRNRLDNKIKLSNDGNTKQYINTRNKLNYVLGNDPLTKQADDFYKIKYDIKKARDQDKYGYVLNSRDGNVASIVPNLMGNGTTPQQFYSLTNIAKPATKNQIAASYLRKIMNDFNIDDGFETIYKKSFATNTMRDKFKNLLSQENYKNLENLMTSINNYRPDKKQLNKIAKINDDALGDIIPYLMGEKVSKTKINRLSKILPDKTKKDIVVSYLGKIKDNLNIDSNFDALYNHSFAKAGVRDKIKTLLPEQEFNNLDTIMNALSNLKSTKTLSKGSNTFNKVSASFSFDDASSWNNIKNSIKNGDKVGAALNILGKASNYFKNDIKLQGIARKNALDLYEFFVNPDNLNESLKVLKALQDTKNATQAKKIFYGMIPKIQKTTMGLNRVLNTNPQKDKNNALQN